MANEPKLQDIYIGFPPQTATVSFPWLQDIYIATLPSMPTLKAFRLQMTQPAPALFPKFKAFRLVNMGPTFWLNGMVMPGLKPPTGKA